MLRLTQVAQSIFCLVSMILTGLFALSLSGVSLHVLSEPDGVNKTVCYLLSTKFPFFFL